MIGLPEIHARVVRLRELAQNMGKELHVWKENEGPLLPLEERQYLLALNVVIGGTVEAAKLLEIVAGRIEAERQSGYALRW
jgi:hypothetical protein